MTCFRKISLAVLGLTIAYGASYAEATVLYVAPDGVDQYFDGSINRCLSRFAPCGTITHALSRVSNNDQILLERGVYQEGTLQISGPTAGLRIVGGYSANFGSLETDSHATVLSGLGGQLVTIDAIGNAVEVSFENMAFAFGRAERGGAVRIGSSSGGSAAVTFDGVWFTDNQARFDGGAIYAVNSPGAGNSLSLTLTRCEFIQDEVWGTTGGALGGNGYGGAVSLRAYSTGEPGAQLFVSESVFSLNSATRAGSNVYLLAQNAGANLRGTFSKNIIRADGDSNFSLGALDVGAASGDVDLSFENNQVLFNRRRGILFNAWAEGSIAASFVNDTITGNTGNGLFVLGNGGDVDVDILNGIVWGNSRSADIYLEGRAVVSTMYTDIGDVADFGTYLPAASNFNADPLLEVVPGGGAFMLSASSPAIDRGVCSLLVCTDRPPRPFCRPERVAPSDDFQGDARPFGPTCDVGADEYVPEPSSILLSAASLCTLAVLATRRRRDGYNVRGRRLRGAARGRE